MPGPSRSLWSRVATPVDPRVAARQALASLCALVLLATSAGAPPAVGATELGDRISSGRRSQSYYESAMLAQDAALHRISQQTRLTRRAIKEARRAVTRSKRGLRQAMAVVAQRRHRLAELETLYADTPVEEIPEGYPDRLRAVRRDLAKAIARRQSMGQRNRTATRMRAAREHRLTALKRQRRATIARRESAEGGLAAYIIEVTRLAQQRAEIQSSVRLASDGVGFTWPSVGRIAQTYGCTGFRLNPPRGSCRHFHDGLDIVAGYGSRVSSAADGVVAYAGWNPWDEGGRAWILVVSHPDGYVTRYGHLVPTSIVRVGEFVRQGQAIGRMGNTGRSTGTHLHFELLQGSATVNPWTYLPEGMVTVRPRAKAAKAKAARAKAAKAKAARAKAAKTDDGPSRDSKPGAGTSSTGWSRIELPAAATAFGVSSTDQAAVACGPSASDTDAVTASSSATPGSVAGSRRSDPGTDSAAAVGSHACVPLRAAAAGDERPDGAALPRRRVPDTSDSGGGRGRGVALPARGTSPLPA